MESSNPRGPPATEHGQAPQVPQAMASSSPNDSLATEQRQASQVQQSSGSPGSAATEHRQLPWSLAQLPRISPVNANSVIIKAHRERMRSDNSLWVDVTDTLEWKRYVAQHPHAVKICSAGLCSAKLVRVMDEWDTNHNFEVVDLCIERADGTHVRLHPSKANPYGVRYGRFSSHGAAGFALWMESPKPPKQPPRASASSCASAAAPQPSPSASAATSDTLLQSTCPPHCKEDFQLSPSASSASTAPGPKPPPSLLSGTSAEAWEMYPDPQSGRLWWYNAASNESLHTLPSTWREFSDPVSGRRWVLDVATGAAHMLD